MWLGSFIYLINIKQSTKFLFSWQIAINYYRLFNVHSHFSRVPPHTLIFLGCCLKFFQCSFCPFFFQMAAWKKARFHTCKSEKKSSEYHRKIRAWWHPIKIWVDFTGHPSNHFSGCRLNGWLSDGSWSF